MQERINLRRYVCSSVIPDNQTKRNTVERDKAMKPKKVKKIRVNKCDCGRRIMVRWDDIGTVEGLLVQAENDSTDLKVFSFCDDELNRVDRGQVVSLGDRIKL